MKGLYKGKMKKLSYVLAASVFALVAGVGTGMTNKRGGVSATGENPDIITVVSPLQKSTVKTDNEYVADYFKNYTPNYGMNFYGRGDILAMNGVDLKWECSDGRYYSVYVDTKANFSSADIYTTVKPEISIYNLLPDADYYWKVKRTDAAGEQAFSRVYTFRTRAYVRAVTIEGVSNVRDLGGWTTSDGKKIKYGTIYRSAQLENVTENGKIEAKRLGIKTDVDLRGMSSAVSPLGVGVKRLNFNAPWYVDETDGNGNNTGLDGDDAFVQAFVNEIKACADPDNYPMIFHCSLGRDRTGTLAAMLLAVCGVEKSDIIKEYELSWLSEIACNNQYIQLSAITKLCNFIEGQNGGTFKDKAVGFLLGAGVEESDITSIRNILLG